MDIAMPDARKDAEIVDFDVLSADDAEIERIKTCIYRDKFVVLKGQDLSASELVALGRRFGRPVSYYEPIYRHPEEELVFVSSNLPRDGRPIGVPKTGAFWHADYQFMPEPFAITIFYPQRLPSSSRGTYFIDMAVAYSRLSDDLKQAIEGTWSWHSSRRYVKIRPEDVYRPLGQIIDEVEKKTPPQRFPTVITHPVTGVKQLFLSEAFTYAMEDADGNPVDGEILDRLLSESGQLDPTFEHQNIFLQGYEPGDIVLWDNRTLIHRALHNPTNEPSESFRVTVLDDYPLAQELI